MHGHIPYLGYSSGGGKWYGPSMESVEDLPIKVSPFGHWFQAGAKGRRIWLIRTLAWLPRALALTIGYRHLREFDSRCFSLSLLDTCSKTKAQGPFWINSWNLNGREKVVFAFRAKDSGILNCLLAYWIQILILPWIFFALVRAPDLFHLFSLQKWSAQHGPVQWDRRDWANSMVACPMPYDCLRCRVLFHLEGCQKYWQGKSCSQNESRIHPIEPSTSIIGSIWWNSWFTSGTNEPDEVQGPI